MGSIIDGYDCRNTDCDVGLWVLHERVTVEEVHGQSDEERKCEKFE